jgi:O-antigen/teichoic acid export membrane protein
VWRFASSIIGAALQFAVSVLLGRLLTPRDFGMVVLAFLVLGFARLLGDLGVGSAVLQRPTLTERHVRAAFRLSVLVGVATAALVAAIAPSAAAMMAEPLLIPIMRTLSVPFVFTGMSTVAAALLRRSLDFKLQFFVEIGRYLVA